MTPPTVERRVRGELGAAIYWVSAPTWEQLGGVTTPPSTHAGWWYWQLLRAKMFHNLIGNKDPNEGNWLVDGAWNLILIDSSRAFTTEVVMPHRLTLIDRDLWNRMLALDEATLTSTLGAWLGRGEIRAILERRSVMQARIDQLVADRGEAAVFVRYGPAAAACASRAARQTVPTPLLGDLDLARQGPIVLPFSEVAWSDTVVRLSQYLGPGATIALAGMCAGHTYGLSTEFAGLVCLARRAQGAEPHDELARLVGQRAEVLSFTEEVDGKANAISSGTSPPIVRATCWRPSCM